MSINSQPADADVALFGNRFVTQEVPSREFPETGIPAEDALRLVSEDLALEGDPARNLATFVTTWMEPQAQQIIAANLHRNFIDHAEYPRTAEIEQRCIPLIATRRTNDDRSTPCGAGIPRSERASPSDPGRDRPARVRSLRRVLPRAHGSSRVTRASTRYCDIIR